MSGSCFFVQIIKFMLIHATAVALGQGHENVIQYIFIDSNIICAKYLRLSSKGLDMRGKSCCSSWHGGHDGGGGGNELKT